MGKKEESIPIPPQVKFGIAIMELDDGSVRRMHINPHNLHVTYGMMLRMLLGEIEDMRAEILAMKLRGMTPPPSESQNSLLA